jgi:hypothetical protein
MPNTPTNTGRRITLPPVPVMAATTDETKAAAAIMIQFSLMNPICVSSLHDTPHRNLTKS